MPATEIKSLCVRFEVKDLSEAGEFSGYGSTFGNVDLGGDVVAAGAFKETIAEHAKNGTMPALLFGHDGGEPVGEWLSWSEDANGLLMKGKLWIGAGIPKAEQAYRMLKGRGMKGLSIGYCPRDYAVDDRTGVRTLKACDVLEVSAVPFPMNPQARVSGIKSIPTLARDGVPLSIREMEDALRDAGLSRSQAKGLLARGYDGLARRDAEPAGDMDAFAAAADQLLSLKEAST